MTEIYLPRLISDEFRKKKKDFLHSLINKYIKEYEKNLYENKSREDKIICPLCGGKYTRCGRSIHKKAKKHQAKIKEIYNFTFN